MRIWFIRHGLSTANVDFDVYAKQADSTIPLTDEGITQASCAGRRLARLIEDHSPLGTLSKVRIWRSPYLRARQTTEAIVDSLQEDSFSVDVRENVALREQHFGVWTGVSTEERRKRWPHESALYDGHIRDGAGFWAPIPCGESQAQVANRVQTVFGAIHHDFEQHGIEDVVIVSHGIAIQCAIMQWMRFPYEWISESPHVENCEIRLIGKGQTGYEYVGTVFEGFESPPIPAL